MITGDSASPVQTASINAQYNVNWMRTEHLHTVRSSRAAKNWQDITRDSDLYPYLEYSPSTAGEPRNEHKRLYGIVKRVDDPFWDTWMPPADWGCRCSVKQVRNPDAASLAKQPPDDVPLPPPVMRNNPGKDGVLFTDQHPMISKVKPAMREKVEKAIRELTGKGNAATSITPPTPSQSAINDIITKNIDTIDDINEVMKNMDNAYKGEYFKHGFKSLQITKKSGFNGWTDQRGNIELKQQIMNDCIKGMNNIKNGIPTTFEQERSLTTLWHEILHNRNSVPYFNLTALQRKYMETANEFVSRKTMPEFMQKLGGQLHHPSLMDSRPNTMYDNWVVNYDQLIVRLGADKTKVLNDVQSYLFNQSYTTQKDGLRDALINNTDMKLKKSNVDKAVKICINEHPDRYLLEVEKIINPVKKTK